MENPETPINKLFSISIDASEYNYSGYPISSDWNRSNKVRMIIAGNDEHLKELLDKFEYKLSKVEDHSGNDSEYDEEISVTITRDDAVQVINIPAGTFYTFSINPKQYVSVKHKNHTKIVDTTSMCFGEFTLLSTSKDPKAWD